MKSFTFAIAATILALPLAALSVPASAATAHNSQAGGIGTSKNAYDSTVGSRRVKHAAKHPDAAQPEADRDAGMYVVKPQPDSEYFSHASGSRGSSYTE